MARAAESAKGHPADAVSLVVLLGVALYTLADLFSLVEPRTETLTSITLFIGSALAISLTLRHVRGRDEAHATRQLRDEVERLNERVGAHFGDDLSQVASVDIGSRLDEQLGLATSWFFRGGSGRWQRREALPRLSDGGKNVDTDYVMQILDPSDKSLCARYGAYRHRQRKRGERRHNEDDPITVRDDLLACLYAAGWHTARGRLKARVFLMPLYSPLRIDAGSSGLVISVADPEAPALLAPATGWFYQSLLDEMRQAMTEVPEALLPDGGEDLYPKEWEDVRGSHVEAMLAAIEVKRPHAATTLFQANAWSAVDYDQVASLVFLGRTQ